MPLLAPLLAALAAADALGPWTANGARLTLQQDASGSIVAQLEAAGGPCDVPAGTELLKGERAQMVKDQDLDALHDDPQWREILDQMKP
ncbi:MAG TPA: hypothetical protein VLW85_15925 [Myxococcales bacterium]|nr:hypothetical protein [Myxococcales bacterium]